MADADEDAIHLPHSHDSATQIEVDLSDETQDFRFLNNLSFLSDSSQATLPRRGEKDFEPNPTLLQADILSASRQAMHNALSFPRLHHPKHKVVGIYAPDGPAPPPESPSNKPTETSTENGESSQQTQKNIDEVPDSVEEEPRKPKPVGGTGIGVSPDACVYVRNPKGQYFRTMGQADRWNRIWLLPEEALYLLERGTLDIRWPSPLTGEGEGGEDEMDKGNEETALPMSLQAAYTCFIGRGGLTVERFSVYTGLRRLGYTLIRAASWDESREPTVAETVDVQRQQQQQIPGLAGVLRQLFQWIYNSNSSTAFTTVGPVVGLGIHRSYNDIYRKLSIIPWYDPVTVPDSPTRDTTTPPFRIAFNVYKPSTPFRKSAPPPPDFRVAVVNARSQTSIPTLSQLGALLESTPLDPPQGEKMDRMLYMRLRHGYRNVILGIVDQGVVSYLRIGDAAFGKERIYEVKNALKSKGFKKGGFSRPKAKR